MISPIYGLPISKRGDIGLPPNLVNAIFDFNRAKEFEALLKIILSNGINHLLEMNHLWHMTIFLILSLIHMIDYSIFILAQLNIQKFRIAFLILIFLSLLSMIVKELKHYLNL